MTIAGKRNKYIQKICTAGIAVLMVTMLVCGCGDKRVVLTTGFSKNEVFVINDESCMLPELMVYLTNVQNRYEEVYGVQIWDASQEDVTLEDNVKETVLARLAQVKTMYLMALQENVTLSAEEETLVAEAAQDYYASLNETEVESLGVTEDILQRMYREYALADKVYEELIEGINPEISDDEARIVKMQHIFFATASKDSEGKLVPYSLVDKLDVYDRAAQVHDLVLEDGADFETLAGKYSESEVISISFGKGEMDPAIEEAAFSMANGEISNILETETGYHILKCVSTLDRKETDDNRKQIIEKLRQETFGERYDAFVSTLVRNLNDELWDNIGLIHNEQVTTMGFFDTYDRVVKGK